MLGGGNLEVSLAGVEKHNMDHPYIDDTYTMTMDDLAQQLHVVDK